MEERDKIRKQLKVIKGTVNHLANLNNTKVCLELSEPTQANRLKLEEVKFEMARTQRNLDNLVKEMIGVDHYNNNVETVRTK